MVSAACLTDQAQIDISPVRPMTGRYRDHTCPRADIFQDRPRPVAVDGCRYRNQNRTGLLRYPAPGQHDAGELILDQQNVVARCKVRLNRARRCTHAVTRSGHHRIAIRIAAENLRRQAAYRFRIVKKTLRGSLPGMALAVHTREQAGSRFVQLRRAGRAIEIGDIFGDVEQITLGREDSHDGLVRHNDKVRIVA
jgi:hypothetical protein